MSAKARVRRAVAVPSLGPSHGVAGVPMCVGLRFLLPRGPSPAQPPKRTGKTEPGRIRKQSGLRLCTATVLIWVAADGPRRHGLPPCTAACRRVRGVPCAPAAVNGGAV